MLTTLRGAARQLIVAEELAGGDPATEMTGPSGQVPLSESRRA